MEQNKSSLVVVVGHKCVMDMCGNSVCQGRMGDRCPLLVVTIAGSQFDSLVLSGQYRIFFVVCALQ